MKTLFWRLWRRVRGAWALASMISDYSALRKRSNRDVIVLTLPAPSRDQVERLRESLNELGLEGTPLIVLPEGTTLRRIPEDLLRRQGWRQVDTRRMEVGRGF